MKKGLVTSNTYMYNCYIYRCNVLIFRTVCLLYTSKRWILPIVYMPKDVILRNKNNWIEIGLPKESIQEWDYIMWCIVLIFTIKHRKGVMNRLVAFKLNIPNFMQGKITLKPNRSEFIHWMFFKIKYLPGYLKSDEILFSHDRKNRIYFLNC